MRVSRRHMTEQRAKFAPIRIEQKRNVRRERRTIDHADKSTKRIGVNDLMTRRKTWPSEIGRGKMRGNIHPSTPAQLTVIIPKTQARTPQPRGARPNAGQPQLNFGVRPNAGRPPLSSSGLPFSEIVRPWRSRRVRRAPGPALSCRGRDGPSRGHGSAASP